MKIQFEPMTMEHQTPIMEIFNYHIKTGTAAFPSTPLPEPFFGMLLKKAEGYPSYICKNEESGSIVGFCQLSAYSPFPTFRSAASVTYFLAEDSTEKGIGSLCLAKLEESAKAMGIRHLIAEVSSENEGSLTFHQKHGFTVVGELKEIGYKLDRTFGVVLLQKTL